MGTRAERGELLGRTPFDRFCSDLRTALKRKPANEPRLAGVVRALVPISQDLRSVAADAVETLVTRGSYTRPVYAATVRALAEAGDRRVVGPLKRALAADDAGGLATLSAACFVDDPGLSDSLIRVATSRNAHVAFAAEVARIARGEADGDHVACLAPMIKESHRIELCCELFVPLRSHTRLPLGIAPALAVLRDAERHLGRWLVLAEIATKAGDPGPLEQARERSREGPASARAAWSMVAWALSNGSGTPPDVRPTLELVARLSDRPSSDRDPSFLYRLAAVGAPAARPMLETIAKGQLASDAAIRSAMHLARDYGRRDYCSSLSAAAKSSKREALRGFAAAALHDCGERDDAIALVPALTQSRQLTTAGWGALLGTSDETKLSSVVTESTFRRVQLGCAQ